MNFDFNIYEYDYNKKDDILVKDSSGVVKCKKEFPIYEEDNKKYLFKPLSKTKPLTTPLFAYSEVFWSTIVNKYFDKDAPIYRLAICKNYSDNHPNRYDKGTIVESIVDDNQKLVNLLEYYNLNPDSSVNIKDYINYCCKYYDYTTILNSKVFRENKDLSRQLANQVLISLLKDDFNYHYENVAFISENDDIVKLAPPIDHEFSLPFLFPDDRLMHSYYSGGYMLTLSDKYEDDEINYKAIIRNINYICSNYPDVAVDFLNNLRQFFIDFNNNDFILPDTFMEDCSSDLYQVYEAIYKDHKEGSKKLHEIGMFVLKEINMKKISKRIQSDILTYASFLYNNIARKLESKKLIRRI